MIFNSGEIKMKCAVEVAEKRPYLPRFGVRMFLNREFDHVEYYGYGPYESYMDKHRASYQVFFRRIFRKCMKIILNHKKTLPTSYLQKLIITNWKRAVTLLCASITNNLDSVQIAADLPY